MTIRKLGATAWVVYGVGSSGYVLMIPVIGYATYFHTRSPEAVPRPQPIGRWPLPAHCS